MEIQITEENQMVDVIVHDTEPPILIQVEDYHGLSAYQLYLESTTDQPPMTLEEWLDNLAGGDLSAKANRNASNLTAQDILLWKEKIGGAKFPEAGNSGDILEKDDTTAEGAKWSNRLTTAENEIDAEVVNRAAADLVLQNRIAAEETARATGLSGKVDLNGANITDEETFKKNIGLGRYGHEIGGVSTTANSLTLLLKPGGNKLTWNSTDYLKSTQSVFPFTPVSPGKLKKVISYGLPEEPYFFMAEGVEGNEATDPPLPQGAYFIASSIIKDNEQITTGNPTGGTGTVTDVSYPGQGGTGGVYPVNVWSGSGWFSCGVNYVAPGILQHKAIYLTLHSVAQRNAISSPKNGFLIYLDDGINPRIQRYNGTEWKDVGGFDSTGLVNKMLSYWDATAGKLVSSGVEWLKSGFLKVTSIVLSPNTGTALPNELGTDGTFLWFGVAKRKLKYADVGIVFNYTPTGDFNLSTVKNQIEASGMIFNDCHILLILGSNSYVCNIDIGATTPNAEVSFGKRGTGSVSFVSTRTLNAGVDNITIINGNESSKASVTFGTSTDILNIRNI